MHGTRVAPMPGRGSGDLPGEGDDAETKDAGVELAAAAPLDRSASDLSTAADGRGSEYHRHLDEEDRAAYSSELMQHALLKARRRNSMARSRRVRARTRARARAFRVPRDARIP